MGGDLESANIDPVKSRRGRLLSGTADSARVESPAGTPSGLSLYAASMRNLLPRLVSSTAVGVVAGCYVGWTWALAWSCFIWANLWISTALMEAAGRKKATPGAGRIARAVTINSLIGTVSQ